METIATDLDKTFEEFKNLVEKELKQVLPYSGISTSGYTGRRFHYSLFKSNTLLKGSPYYHNNKSEFIHFTSLKSLFSILNEQAIRLYSLSNSDDEREFEFASKKLNFNNEEIIERQKQMLLSFSCCDYSEINNENIWNKYGNNGQGIAIKFIAENHNKWMNFILAKIDYEEQDYFSALIEKVKEFEKDYNVQIDLNIQDILAYHKNPQLKYEKEYRLLFNSWNCNNHENSTNPEIFLDVNKRNEVVRYFKLPLFRNKGNLNPVDVLFQRPKITLMKIIFGEKLTQNVSELRDAINNRALINLGYRLDVQSLNQG